MALLLGSNIKVGHSRLVRSPLDALLLQHLLEVVGRELGAAVGLDALDGKRHLVQNVLRELRCIGCGSPQIDLHHLEPGTIVDGDVLKESRCDLHRVHLNLFTRHFLLVSIDPPAARGTPERRNLVALQHFMGRRRREVSIMKTLQLVLDSTRTDHPLLP